MSSHHVVREKQEPALLVLDLEGFEDEWLGQLLEWSPTVMATMETAEQLNSRGIKIDFLLCESTGDDNQPNINYLVTMQNNAFETAMEWLINSKYPAVNIIAGNFEQEKLQHHQHVIDMVVFCQSKKIYPVSSGFNKWKPAGELVWVISGARDLQTAGLEQIGKNKFITTADALIRLNFSDEFIFIAEAL